MEKSLFADDFHSGSPVSIAKQIEFTDENTGHRIVRFVLRSDITGELFTIDVKVPPHSSRTPLDLLGDLFRLRSKGVRTVSARRENTKSGGTT